MLLLITEFVNRTQHAAVAKCRTIKEKTPSQFSKYDKRKIARRLLYTKFQFLFETSLYMNYIGLFYSDIHECRQQHRPSHVYVRHHRSSVFSHGMVHLTYDISVDKITNRVWQIWYQYQHCRWTPAWGRYRRALSLQKLAGRHVMWAITSHWILGATSDARDQRNQACRGYEISHPYPHPYPQIFSWISVGISMDIPMDYL